MVFAQERFDRHPDLNPQLLCAVERLQSLHEDSRLILNVVRFGQTAPPLLRELLFRSGSGRLRQARCRACEALALLEAYEVLEEYLQVERPTADLDELGEEIVVSAAARAIARRRDKRSFELLESLALRKALPGVLIALGSFKRIRTLSIFISALAHDEVRLTAEAVLRTFGGRARPYLLSAACDQQDEGSLSEGVLCRRRSALGLLGELRSNESDWHSLKPLLASGDLETAILTAGIGLKVTAVGARSDAIRTLRGLRAQADWLRRMQIDQYLQRCDPKRSRRRRCRTAVPGGSDECPST